MPYVRSDLDDKKHSSCQKLLFSATLTRDPSRIASMGLREPKYFIVQAVGTDSSSAGGRVGGGRSAPDMLVSEKFTMPQTLTVRH